MAEYRTIRILEVVADFNKAVERIRGNTGFVRLVYNSKIAGKLTEYYFLDTALHRMDGPSIVNGENEVYYLNGGRHREDGPAVFVPEQNRLEWWLNGREIAESELMNYFPLAVLVKYGAITDPFLLARIALDARNRTDSPK